MRCLLIRHGKTKGNLEGRYIGGRTDESLCASGTESLRREMLPAVRAVIASPMKRCIETAELLFPGKAIQVVEEFRECDFGEFENHNYAELQGKPEYQAWIDSGGEFPFPGGESKAEFSARCVRAFEICRVTLKKDELYAFVVHGGTIMSIMEAFAKPGGSYYDFQVRNGEGFLLLEDGKYEKWSG